VDYYLTVGQLTTKIKEVFEFDPSLQDAWVLGEVSNLSRPRSGHIYFTLKDDTASLPCVMWKSTALRLGTLLETGTAIVAHGRISVYEPRGLYQLYVDDALAVGTGQLFQEYEILKERLQAQGLFDSERKRSLPSFPRRIGVVTSASGAAFQDILNVLGRRYPIAEVVLSPTLVQGMEAPPQIVRAINDLNILPDIDVIILARGGGSLEELWAFNDEAVAQAIFASKTPIVTGVGHETDYTIADFVADFRAPTPSAAAEIVAPDLEKLPVGIVAWQWRLVQIIEQKLETLKQHLRHQQQILALHSPQADIDTQKQHIDLLTQHATATIAQRIALQKSHVQGLSARLEALNPQATLERGYAIVLDRESGQVIHQVGQASAAQALTVRVSDGDFGATVE
jgi:exodeoxyribonuclease VII large subunit